MPHSSLWHFLGSELRLWRSRAGLSMDALGERVHFSGDIIGKVEKAERSPNPLLIEACDRELRAEGTLVRLMELAAEHDRRASEHDTNADRSSPRPATQTGLISSEDQDGSADELARALTRRDVSASTVHVLGDLVQALRRLDDEVGPRRLAGSVANSLTWVTHLVAEADHRGAGFSGLCKLAAELAQLAGWLSFDMNEDGDAVRHLRSAHRAAEVAGDDALAAYSLGWRSIVVGQADAAAGLSLARAARRRAGGDAAASVQAWLWRVEAEALAGLGDHHGAGRALEYVATSALQPRSERDPSWTYFIDGGQIAAYRGVVYVRLGDGLRAELALHEALRTLQPSFVRDRCLYLTYLVAAHLQQRQPEAAAAVAVEALRLAIGTESPRSVMRLRSLRRGLDPWKALPDVQMLDELLEAH